MSVNVTMEKLSEPIGFRPEALDVLWSQIPAGLRTVTWNSPDIPDEFAEGFTRPAGRAPGHRFTLDFAGLPPAISRELTWCAWQFIAIGAKVPVPTFQTLVRRLNDAFESMPQGRAPDSLLERTPQWWYRTLAATRARRTGELPALSTRRAMERVLRRCYQMLWWACDEQPWWQRETWGLRLDPRIPRRPHEPQGAGRLSFHSLNPFWLRRRSTCMNVPRSPSCPGYRVGGRVHHRWAAEEQLGDEAGHDPRRYARPVVPGLLSRPFDGV
jgi:hypothetical protein